MQHRLSFLAPALFAISAGATSAQQLCNANETVSVCYNRVLAESQAAVQNEQAPAVKVDATARYADTATKTNTGSLNSIAGLSSGVKDFLPLLNFTGLLGDISEDQQSGIVAVDLNLNVSDTDNNTKVRALIDTNPKLFDPIRSALPQEGRGDLEKTLLDGADEANNVTLELAYNFTSERFGRSFVHHQRFLERLFDQALEEIDEATDAVLDAELALTTIQRDFGNSDRTLGQFERDERSRLETAIRLAVTQLTTQSRALDGIFTSSRLSMFGQLVNNQPQLHVKFSQRYRDELFGPNTRAVSLTYEQGFANLNGFLSGHADECSESGDVAECLRSYGAYVAENEAQVKAGSRLAVSFRFARLYGYEFMRPEIESTIHVPSGSEWSASLDYGRLIGVQDDGTASARLDISIGYERPSYEVKNERFLASLMVTRKFGDVSLPFGVVFANRTEYLSDMGNELSAHVALKFDLFPGFD